MNNPKSIFTAPTIGLKRRHSDSVKDESTHASARPSLQSLAPAETDPAPASATAGPGDLWHGRALPQKYPWHPIAEPSGPLQQHSTLVADTPEATVSKRPASVTTPEPEENSSPSRKKQKVGQRPNRSLDPFDFVGPSTGIGTPPSPLFFSNSPSIRPALPPRFSSAEAAAKMLSKTRGEDSGIKTVTLARGTPASGSPPPSRGKLSRLSSHTDSAGGSRISSPELPDRADTARTLAQIGIIELLDQDERATFIIDLADASNYDKNRLQIAYANPSLRSEPGLFDAVSGKIDIGSPDSPSAGPYGQFKSWLLGVPLHGESFDMSSYSYQHGGFHWAYSTLGKRLRVASGTSTTPASKTPASSAGRSRSAHTPGLKSPLDKIQNAPAYSEPQDYFGDSLPSPSEMQTLKMEAARETPSTGEGTRSLETLVETSAAPRAKPILRRSKSEKSATPSKGEDGDTLDPAMPFIELKTSKEVGFFDWTRLPSTDTLPEHIEFARGVDWAATALGPMHTWSADLRQMCNLIMASPHPAAMYWGEDLVAIYNEAYTLLAGAKHPTLMGQGYRHAWAEIWDEVKDVFENAQSTGQATMKDDDCLFIMRSHFLEETYFSWSIIPIVGADGTVKGLYNPAFEKTRRKVAERRMLTLREVGERTAAARDVKGFWSEVLKALDYNEFDTPFVLLYSLTDDTESGDDSSVNSSSVSATRQCILEGALGVPEEHPAAPKSVDLKSGAEGWVPVFREVLKTNKTKVLDVGGGQFSPTLLEGLNDRGFGDPARSVVVCPIHPTTGESTLGFLVMGINPRRPYDDDYSLFLQLLSRQLATSLASVVLFEEEIKRGQNAAKLAALERIELSEQLAQRTQEAIESETKFTRMAEFAPVGMFIADSQGRITYCNDMWYDISRVPRSAESTDSWIDWVTDEDKPLVRSTWHGLVVETKPATAEFRFKAPWLDRTGTSGDTWVLFSAYPETYRDGSLKSVFGSITNISQQKWAEGFQKRKTEEAVELKRQQENFIDITSHEMRNPLSAILQCADEIIASLSETRNNKPDLLATQILDDNIDAAQTIALCAQHQKRIVDDVLTLSKLDSALLLVTPVDAQPLGVAQKALKMFEGELQTSDIDMNFTVDPSFTKLGVDWVRFDPSRVLQVLINLTTNAIKFTTQQTRRVINVTIGASLERPESSQTLVNFFPTRSKRVDMTAGPDWGDGEEIFLHFTVEDTGRGLTTEEKKLLFMRFRQASPRTHVQYGGSGLGLFISRELTELQGGQIGVASESGKGSTFAFYVKARKASPPKDAVDLLASASASSRKTVEKQLTSGDAPPPTVKDFAVGKGSAMVKDDGLASDLNILIVEDNLVNQRVLQKQLAKMGAETHVANHGGEAIEKLRESHFWNGHEAGATELSVVLMDQEMPVMDGLTCTRKIRELEKEGKLVRHVPIIAVTANARSEQINTALEAGMDDVVSKPFRIPELIPKIRELIAKCNAVAVES